MSFVASIVFAVVGSAGFLIGVFLMAYVLRMRKEIVDVMEESAGVHESLAKSMERAMSVAKDARSLVQRQTDGMKKLSSEILPVLRKIPEMERKAEGAKYVEERLRSATESNAKLIKEAKSLEHRAMEAERKIRDVLRESR